MMSGRMKVIILCLIISSGAFAQNKIMSDSIYSEENSNKVFLAPSPLIGGEYFEIKYPDYEKLNQLEVISIEGNIVTNPILLTKMGLYMPKVKKGEYYLKIYLSTDTIMKKVVIN